MSKEINKPTFIKAVEEYKAVFRCSCGEEFKARLSDVKRGSTKSCGCYQRQRTVETSTTHGLKKHPLYRVWTEMKRRCYDKKRMCYKYYGGRGITVCDGWISDFGAFYDWAINNGYEEWLTLDRTNNDGNYKPSNCRFVTQAVNNQNKGTAKLDWQKVGEIRDKKLHLVGVKTKTLAESYGVCVSMINKILSNKAWREEK